jgi:hypothetical protein
MALNLVRMLDDAMRVNVALMDEPTIDNAQLLRLLDIKLLRQASENVRVLFTELGGTLPRALSVAPIERGGRFFTLANRILHHNAEQQNAQALERDAFAKAYSDLLSALSFAHHLTRQVRNGVKLRNEMLVVQRIRNTAEVFRTFRLHVWIKMSPSV